MTEVESKHGPGTVGYISANNPRYHLFYDALERLQVPRGTKLRRASGATSAFNRNDIAQRREGDWVFFLDDDMIFEPDALLRLLDNDVTIVGGLYARRFPPHAPLVYKKVDMDLGFGEPYTWEELATMESTIEVPATGGGALLIKKAAFNLLPTPWFEPSSNTATEDVIFCDAARKKGLKVYADLNVQFAHLTEAMILPKRENNRTWRVHTLVSNRQWHS